MNKTLLSLFLLSLIVVTPFLADNPEIDFNCPDEQPALNFSPGEKLEYGLSWAGIKGANMTFFVKTGKYREQKILKIISTLKSTSFFSLFHKIDNRLEALIDPKFYRTLKYTKEIHEGGNDEKGVTKFDYKKGKALYTETGDKNKREKYSIPECIMDSLSGVFWLRQLDLKPGESKYIRIFADGEKYPIKIEALEYENIKTKAGRFKCIKLQPKMDYTPKGFFKKEGKVWIWISTDENRLPVKIKTKIKVGSIYGKLIRYTCKN